MLQFMKKWRQAYLEDKAERSASYVSDDINLSIDGNLPSSFDVKRFIANFCESASEAINESLEEDENKRRRY